MLIHSFSFFSERLLCNSAFTLSLTSQHIFGFFTPLHIYFIISSYCYCTCQYHQSHFMMTVRPYVHIDLLFLNAKKMFTPLTVMRVCMCVHRVCPYFELTFSKHCTRKIVRLHMDLIILEDFELHPVDQSIKSLAYFHHVLISSINTPLISGSSVGTLNHTLYRSLSHLKKKI